MLNGKKILLGVASSVAIYKALELVRLFKKEGAEVFVVMTPHATQLVSPQLFQAVSGNRVCFKQFDAESDDSMPHVNDLKAIDLVILAPATASLIGRYSMGLASDLLTTTLLATRAPVVLAPAMNVDMFQHPIVQEHLVKLRSFGVTVVDPVEGELACGVYGSGHLAPLEEIVLVAERALTPQTLVGKRVLISSGATYEALDPVRGFTNRSSGKMGAALVKAAFLRGAQVTVISGRVEVEYPSTVEVIRVESTRDMRDRVVERFSDCDLFISAAAVSDYRPAIPFDFKLKKQASFSLDLVENPDILAEVASMKRSDQKVVGFVLESEDLERFTELKFVEKGVDFMVGNSTEVLRSDEGEFNLFDGRTHRSLRGTKLQVSHQIIERLSLLMNS